MTLRPYDLVVLGATGYTGKHVVAEIIKTIKLGKCKTFSFAVAARSEEKLDKILQEISQSSGEDLSQVGKIIADVSDNASILEMATKCKVVLNCVGPYRLNYGREVVEACIESGASLVDLSAEAEYLEGCQRDLDGPARDKGVYIVGACGFDSIPADMGIIHLVKNFGGDVNSVEEIIELDTKGQGSKINFATWESIVNGVASVSKVKPIRKDLERTVPEPPKAKHQLKRRFILHKNEAVDGWCVPFPGSDCPVVHRSQRLLYNIRNQRPVQMHAYVKTNGYFSGLAILFGAVVLGIFIFFPFGLGRKLLLNFPAAMSMGYVTKEGPTKEEMERLEFTVTLSGKGWAEKLEDPAGQHKDKPTVSKMVKVSGKNPGYGATSTCLLQSALTILHESDKMPLSGGAYPPAAAFSETTLIERLHAHGVTFEIMNA